MTAMANTSVMLSTCVATITDTATVMGAVGPDTSVWVPPKSAANSPIDTAAYRPATAPRPEPSPKASASGSPTTPAVMPPRTSPRRSSLL